MGLWRSGARTLAVAVACLAWAAAPVRAEPPAFAFTTVEGSGGVPLNVAETGNPAGREILFIHGMSASYLAWLPQLQSDLARRYRLVAFDMRGHGGSGKPWRPEDYAGSRVWADDVAAVIAAKHLARPVIVAWSFGGHVALAYMREYGLDHAAALNLTGTLAGLVQVEHPNPTPRYQAILAGSKLRGSRDLQENFTGYREMIRGFTVAPLEPAFAETMFLSALMQPSYVRRAQTGLPLKNADLAPKLDLPVLVSVGSEDEEWPVASAKAAAAMLPKGSVSVYEKRGHFVSAEDPARFNAELVRLVESAH